MRKIKITIGLLLAVLALVSCNPNDGTSGLGSNEDNAFAQNFGSVVTRDFIGQVVDTDNHPIQDATITIGSLTAQTDVNGIFIINGANVYQKFAYVTAEKTGYINGSRSLVPTTGRNTVKIMLLANVPTATIQAGVASEVSIYSGTKVNFDGAFQDESGAPYTGAVSVMLFHLTPSDVNIEELMPGMLYAKTSTNEQAVLATYGMINVELRGDNGQKLNIAEGHTAEITIRIDDSQLATAPATIALWHFDEAKGYWKEDGVATKAGNYYVGEVSHFSWWNCDAQFPTVTLTTTIVDEAGHALANVKVGLLADGFSYTKYGITNADGEVIGLVPSDKSMTLTVTDVCGNVIYTSTVGPFTTNTALPDIVITTTMASNTTISGTLQKCDNSNVTNGYVLMNYGTNTTFSAVTSGAFSFETLICSANNTAFTLEGFDYDNLQTTGAINYTATAPTTNVGIITACNTISEFISYQIDSNPQVLYLSNITAGSNGTPGLAISASTPTEGIYINGSTSIPGIYTSNQFSIESGGIGYINGGNDTVQFNLSSFGAVGEYIDLTFNGTYSDGQQIGVTHTITGTVHVLRDN